MYQSSITIRVSIHYLYSMLTFVMFWDVILCSAFFFRGFAEFSYVIVIIIKFLFSLHAAVLFSLAVTTGRVQVSRSQSTRMVFTFYTSILLYFYTSILLYSRHSILLCALLPCLVSITMSDYGVARHCILFSIGVNCVFCHICSVSFRKSTRNICKCV